MKKLILLLWVIIAFASSNTRNFTLYKTNNIKGDVVMIGNSVLQTPDGQCPSITTQNNDITAVYADKDNDPNTFNSTWAQLKLPAGVDSSKIVYALLYWQGRFITPDHSNDILEEGKKIKLKLFGFNDYITINSIPEKFNYVDEISRKNYQGVADITDLLKQSIDYVNSNTIFTTGYQQPVWVANLATSANGTNLYGAWSLIVVYKDDNAHLKNITLYDGYDEVFNNTKSYTLTGFLTPKRGTVNAKFMVFAGEGDVVYRDSISLSNPNGFDILLGEDFFHSSEDIDGRNIIDRDPNCQNTIGIDLRTISIGTNSYRPIIGNNQNSTTVTLSSDGDQYFPGVFIFSTDLYEPRICYYIDHIVDENHNVVYANKHFIQDIEANKTYQISFWIANMKKTPFDEDIEVANKVQVFLDTTDFNYTKSSTFVKNVGLDLFSHKTDAKDSDIFEFSTPNNYTYRLGTGANGTEGGTIDVSRSFFDLPRRAFVDMNGTFILNNQTKIDLDDIFHFKAMFSTSSVNINKIDAIPIPKCVEFNTQGGVFNPRNGNFNVVNKNFTGNIDPLNHKDPKNALYTQIANKQFTVKLLSLKDDLQTLTNFTGNIEVDLIHSPNYADNDNDDMKLAKCKNATPLAQTFIYLNNESSKNISFVYPKINKNVTFRIVKLTYTGCNQYHSFIKRIICLFQHFIQNFSGCTSTCMNIKSTNGARKCIRCMFRNRNMQKNYICARDNFAIRPDKFLVTANGVNRADNNISFVSIKALDYHHNIIPEYNTSSVDLNMSAIDKNPSCYSANVDYDFTFKNGIAKINYIKYPEVGDISLRLAEKLGKEYAIVDKNDTADTQRLITKGVSAYFTVLPDHLAVYNTSVNNFNNSNFTYLSNDLNMSATLNTIIEAQNKNNQITHNYSDICYAKDVNVTISHDSNTSMNNLNYILTNYSTSQKDKNISFIINKNKFMNGSTPLSLLINFDRNSSKGKEVEPFRFTINTIYTKDKNDTNGSNNINQSLTFIYAKAITQDMATIEQNIDLPILFEKFENKKWVINSLHNNKIYGDVNDSFTTSNVNIDLNETNINYGKQLIYVSPNTNTRPYKVRLHLNIPIWLWYSLYNKDYVTPSNINIDCSTHLCANILFLGKGQKGWSGIGTNEKENNVSKNTINSNIKQNIKKDIIFHRLTW